MMSTQPSSEISLSTKKPNSTKIHTHAGEQFFRTKKDVYDFYLKITDQKLVTAQIISQAIPNLFKSKKINLLCIGGGNGAADLKVAKLLPRYKFNISNVDSSQSMCEEFSLNAKKLHKNVKLILNQPIRFEDPNFSPKPADLIFCINSIYFLNGWKQNNAQNPLLKIYNSLKEEGVAVIVLKSNQSDHFKVKKQADAGNTTGLKVRKMLNSLKISYYWEIIPAKIDITSLYQNQRFKPDQNGHKILDFLSKDNWLILNKKSKTTMIRLLNKYKTISGDKIYLNSQYELIWIRKSKSYLQYSQKNDPISDYKTDQLAKEIKPLIKNYLNFPIKNINFRDTSTLLLDSFKFRKIIKYAVKKYKPFKITSIVAKDMQGVLWAGAIAQQLNVGIVPTFRKDVTPPVLTTTYSHEYNPHRVLNLKKDSIKKGDRVLIVDYIVATGATVYNMARLIEHLGGRVVGVFSLIELVYLNPRKYLNDYPVHTIIKYHDP